MNPKNAAELLAQSDVDGGLIAQIMGCRPASRAAWTFLLTETSVSPKYWRRSEWPIMTYFTPRSKNAAELLAQSDVDGGLIGGAALKPDQFVDIVNAANQE